MGDVTTSHDARQHCSAVKHSNSRVVAMDCPYTGRGDEFSPTNLVEAALSGCMLLAMGAMAVRHEIDLSGTRVDTTITATDKPVIRVGVRRAVRYRRGRQSTTPTAETECSTRSDTCDRRATW